MFDVGVWKVNWQWICKVACIQCVLYTVIVYSVIHWVYTMWLLGKWFWKVNWKVIHVSEKLSKLKEWMAASLFKCLPKFVLLLCPIEHLVIRWCHGCQSDVGLQRPSAGTNWFLSLMESTMESLTESTSIDNIDRVSRHSTGRRKTSSSIHKLFRKIE